MNNNFLFKYQTGLVPPRDSSALQAGSAAKAPVVVNPLAFLDTLEESDEVKAVAELREYFKTLEEEHGLSVDNFNVGRTIGSGSFGQVKLVTFTIHGIAHAYALKILHKASILKTKQLDHVRNEVKILKELNHPFIATLYTSFSDKFSIYLLMEYVLGGELYSILSRCSALSPKDARFYSAEVVLAIAYLHSKDILYRDLKPENVLLDAQGHVKVVDFGFAKQTSGRTWTLCGTTEYLSPEMILSKAHGKPTDWWSFGILLYELLCGYTPFFKEGEHDGTDIYQRILGGLIQFPPRIDPYAKDLIKRLCTADISHRFGCLRGGVSDILQHKFFRNINWEQVYQRKLTPPYVPTSVSFDDTSNFETYPEENLDPNELLISDADQELFNEF